MSLLALDLSTSTGWALFDDQGSLFRYGQIATSQTVEKYGEYPFNFIASAEELGKKIEALVDEVKPTEVCIEEINNGRSRYSQRILEWAHFVVVSLLKERNLTPKYINTGEWRGNCLKLSVSSSKKLAKIPLKEFANKKKTLESLKKQCKGASKETKQVLMVERKQIETELALLKTDLMNKCLWGKIDKKSIAIAYVNANFNLNLKKSDDDVADAICLGVAKLKGCKVNSNYTVFGHESRERKKNEQR
jgi:Holliday junction resolvasome RuvABC endonuclease subunit